MNSDVAQHIKDAIKLADTSVDVMRAADKVADTNAPQDFKRLHALQEQRRHLVEAYALRWR